MAVGDVINVTGRLQFDKIDGVWSLDSNQRSIIIEGSTVTFGHYIHLRQALTIVGQGLEILKGVTHRGLLYIVNRSSTDTITIGKSGITPMFKMKPTEIMLIRPAITPVLWVISSVDGTLIDILLIQNMDA